MNELSDAEREEVVAMIRQGRTLPARYRASLFEDAPEVELIWPGKTTEVERVVLPFQSVEHIDEPRAETVLRPSLFSMDQVSGRQVGGWSNKLIWGDNKLVLASLIHGPLRNQIDEAGGLQFVYIDPPFDVGDDFSVETTIGDDDETIQKEPSVVEIGVWRDTWGRGRDSFVSMLSERLRLIHRLMAPDGSLMVHLDYRTNALIRVVLDEIFGPSHFVNEIVWRKTNSPKAQSEGLGNQYDTLLWYAKSERVKSNPVYRPFDEKSMKPYSYQDKRGRYRLIELEAQGVQRTQGRRAFEFMGRSAPWLYSLEKLENWRKQGLIYTSENGRHSKKQYLDDMPGVVLSDIWVDEGVAPLQGSSAEANQYPTQKPEALLRRVLELTTSKGDLVADFFCGSGTTAAVAEILGRKWIAVDLGRFAIHTTRKRLIDVQRSLAANNESYRAFEILNLGSYERQYFVGVETNLSEVQRRAQSSQRREQFLALVLQAYGATRSEQLPGFHGVKENACVFVGPLDAPITQNDVRSAILAAKKQGITRVDILGFEFEMGIKPAMVDEARDEGLTFTLRYIPNDVFDRRAIAKGQVKFFDVGYVDVGIVQDKKGSVRVEIKDFGVFYAQEDADAAAAGLKPGGARIVIDSGQVVRVKKDKKGKVRKETLTKSWTDWIDYWSVDFDFESQKEVVAVEENGVVSEVWTGRYIFENQWQDFRTRDERSLKTVSAPHTYDTPGEYKVAVKVVDVFGNDTTKVVKVKVK